MRVRIPCRPARTLNSTDMEHIDDYMKRTKEERQAHLRLDESCIERGAKVNYTSFMCKGLLAHLFDTTLPSGHKIHCCHACNNGNCSNPNHLYWGTVNENAKDLVATGRNGLTKYNESRKK